jgi:hypothetical protein
LVHELLFGGGLDGGREKELIYCTYPSGLEGAEFEATFETFAVLAELPFSMVDELGGSLVDERVVFAAGDGDVHVGRG